MSDCMGGKECCNCCHYGGCGDSLSNEKAASQIIALQDHILALESELSITGWRKNSYSYLYMGKESLSPTPGRRGEEMTKKQLHEAYHKLANEAMAVQRRVDLIAQHRAFFDNGWKANWKFKPDNECCQECTEQWEKYGKH